jgi:hypothetical protein
MLQPRGERQLVGERLGVVAFEHRDEQRQRQERVRAQLEQFDVVVAGQRRAFLVGEGQPGAGLAAVAVENSIGAFQFPPGDRSVRIVAVSLDQQGITVDGVQEFVDQILAHAGAPFGYQVK